MNTNTTTLNTSKSTSNPSVRSSIPQNNRGIQPNLSKSKSFSNLPTSHNTNHQIRSKAHLNTTATSSKIHDISRKSVQSTDINSKHQSKKFDSKIPMLKKKINLQNAMMNPVDDLNIEKAA